MKYREGQILKLKFNDLHGKYMGKLSFKILPRDIIVSMTNEYNRQSHYGDWHTMGESVRKFHSAGGFIGSSRDPALWNEDPKFFILKNLKSGKTYLFEAHANGQTIIGTSLDEKESD
jgi:hypothetical protein